MRARKEILDALFTALNGDGTVDAAASFAVNGHAAMEVLLDLRDLLIRIEQNTEAVAVRAELVIPKERQCDPPMIEVTESESQDTVNALLREGWKLIDAAAGPPPLYILARRKR